MRIGIAFLNLSIGLVGLVMCGSVLLSILAGPKMGRTERHGFLAGFSCLAVLSACNLAGQLMKGLPGTGFKIALYISNFGEFFCTALLAYIVMRMLLSKLDIGEEKEIISGLCAVLLAMHLALLIGSQFTGLCYIIDENNVYQRSSGYVLTYVVPFFIMVFAFYLLITYSDQLAPKERRAFWVYYLVPLLAMYIQIFVYGIYFVNFALIISAVWMYVLIIEEQRNRYYMQIRTNESLKTDIMLSQIQPHFLYNSLAVIREICLDDQEKAAAAIDDFAKYLRHNMNSLDMNKPVPFEQELEHTRRYIELQQLRFGKELDIKYNIGCSDFRIPSLTLQPLVENAVRYGIRKNDTGEGSITISTEEFDDRYEVKVIDDGPGFDPDNLSDDDRSHIGLKNVRNRIKFMTKGTLIISSKIGEGTTVTMVIPKE